MSEWDFIDDKECIPLVKYFNENGLKTWMCCSGKEGHGYGFYWIAFSRNIDRDDIERFMAQHINPDARYRGICGPLRGWFCQRIWWKPDDNWMYIAVSPDRANEDLNYFILSKEQKDV